MVSVATDVKKTVFQSLNLHSNLDTHTQTHTHDLIAQEFQFGMNSKLKMKLKQIKESKTLASNYS